MNLFKVFLPFISLASASLFAAPPPTIEANFSVTGGGGAPVTISLPESFSFTLDGNFSGWTVYLVAQDAFSAPVTPAAYGYLTGGTGLRLETSTGLETYNPSYTAGNSYFGTRGLVLAFEFTEQVNFVAGTVITINAGTVSTYASPAAAAPDLAGPYHFAVTDGNGNYYEATSVSQVPEPATFSAIAGGLVLMGVAMRRRRA